MNNKGLFIREYLQITLLEHSPLLKWGRGTEPKESQSEERARSKKEKACFRAAFPVSETMLMWAGILKSTG